jgi:phage repressor protein C with HTH and peptisase S24 domain
MRSKEIEKLASIKTFTQLIAYLRDEMGWPIAKDSFEEVDDLFFDYSADELGIDPKTAVKIEEIKRLRPLSPQQPWGIFFVKFAPKRLPVLALRRILGQVAIKKRSSANKSERIAWSADDLLFVSNYGEGNERQISFAHFSVSPASQDLPKLKVLGWDDRDTALHLDAVAKELTGHLAWPRDESDADEWREKWRAAFTIGHRETIATSRDLAKHLAHLARRIRDRIKTALAIETEKGALTKLMTAFQRALVHDLDGEGFADMYAQTIAYGLLSARIADPDTKTANDFASHMRTNPFLGELMETFLKVGGRCGKAGGPGIDFDELGVSEVIELLDSANIEAVVRDFGDRNPQEDPVIHFYELFLKEYDAKKRMQRGVFYTPRPVVSYIVRSVHELLRTQFGLADGLADTTSWGDLIKQHKHLQIPEGVTPDQDFIQILDPATGTGTFLVEVIDLIYATLIAKWKSLGHGEKKINELWNDYVPRHLLTRLHGYELLMAPYAIAHLKLGLKLHETGYRFGSDMRARVYLTNALEPAQEVEGRLEVIIPALAHEAAAVSTIKRSHRFTVIIGNPPYSKMSGNLSEAAIALVDQFRYVDGERIVEKGALALELNLQDDYVKFWGLLCRELLATQIGVGSFISNSRYLGSPTLRGLRGYLCGKFSDNYFLNLGGQVSERKAINAPDENVFDIEQGVAIGAVVRPLHTSKLASVRSAEFYGTRSDKYAFLSRSSIVEVTDAVSSRSPYYRFNRSEEATDVEFDAWPPLNEIMPFNSGCVITSRDNLAIDFDRKSLLRKIARFAASRPGDRAIEEEIGFSVKAKWDVERCKKEIRALKRPEEYVRPILYRPFDTRFVFYLPSLLDTPSKPVCEAVYEQDNLVLLSPGVKTTSEFTHALVSRFPAEKKACSHDRATQMFPLYARESKLLGAGAPNISAPIASRMSEREVFGYIYAILYSSTYRTRYGAALRDSYPRIPVAAENAAMLGQLARLGNELVALHLLESPKVYDPFAKYLAGSVPEVEKVSWSNNTVWLDKNQSVGFSGVPEEVWSFHVGGYQACEKWLKDRKGRTLTKEDIAHYQKIVGAIANTIRLMKEIDAAIEQHGGWPKAFQEAGAPEAAVATQPARPAIVTPKPKDRYVTCVPLMPLTVAAGSFGGGDSIEEEQGKDDDFEWTTPKTNHRLRKGMFVAQVSGKSMEPLIRDGAWCLFRSPLEGSRHNAIVLVQLRDMKDPETGERYTVKRYSSQKAAKGDTWRHTKIVLSPINQAYEPIVITENAEERVRVLAEFVEVLSTDDSLS